MLPADDPFSLALLYHLNSEPWFVEAPGAGVVYEPQYKETAPAGSARRLPRPDFDAGPLARIRDRRSCRAFADHPLPAATLGTLLAGAYGVTGAFDSPDGAWLARAVPSAGALYPLELYVVTRNVGDVPDGLHHYHVLDHGLEPLGAGVPPRELGDCLLDQHECAEANAVCIFTAVFERTLRKYGARGYRYILLEAGHAAQNLCLLAVEHGLATLCVGGFADARFNRRLGLDGRQEAALYCVAVGYPAEAPAEPGEAGQASS